MSDPRDADDSAAKPRELVTLSRQLRGSLASLRAAAETLQAFPTMDLERSQRLLGVVVEEAERLGSHLDNLDRLSSRALDAAGPSGSIDDGFRRRISVPALLEVLRRAATSTGLDFEPEVPDEPDEPDQPDQPDQPDEPDQPNAAAIAPEPLLDVALLSLSRAITSFASALRRDLAVSRCSLTARLESLHVLIDLAWRPEPGEQARLHAWQSAALEGESDEPGAGLRPVARAHDGEAWFILGRDDRRAHVRILLPLKPVAARAAL